MREILLSNDTEIAIIGDIHEHEDQYQKILDIVNPSKKRILVSAGDVYDKGWGRKQAESILDSIKSLNDVGLAYMVKGNHEIKHLKRVEEKREFFTDQLYWVKKQPLALSFVFPNGNRITVVHGGVTPHHKIDDLGLSPETSFIRTIDENGNAIPLRWKLIDGIKSLMPEKLGKPWHDYYDGRFGYIASGHDAQQDGIAKFYNFSCNLDSAVFQTGKLSCQIFDRDGKRDLVVVDGLSKRKKAA